MLPAKYRSVLVFFATFWFYASFSHGSGFRHSTILDPHGKYHLKWRFDRRTITFEIEVETRGYVGFGLSPNGAMALSDIVIGGVTDGRPYLQVCTWVLQNESDARYALLFITWEVGYFHWNFNSAYIVQLCSYMKIMIYITFMFSYFHRALGYIWGVYLMK